MFKTLPRAPVVPQKVFGPSEPTPVPPKRNEGTTGAQTGSAFVCQHADLGAHGMRRFAALYRSCGEDSFKDSLPAWCEMAVLIGAGSLVVVVLGCTAVFWVCPITCNSQ